MKALSSSDSSDRVQRKQEKLKGAVRAEKNTLFEQQQSLLIKEKENGMKARVTHKKF